jgi:hypothetical protein
MTIRERIARFWSRVRAWCTLRRSCVLCGYGIRWVGLPDGYDVPLRLGEQWVHQSCFDYHCDEYNMRDQ